MGALPRSLLQSMRLPRGALSPAALVAAALALAVGAGAAQAAGSSSDAEVRRMIDSLRPPGPAAAPAPAPAQQPRRPTTTGRTRNLVVEPTPEALPDAPAPASPAAPAAAAPAAPAASPAPAPTPVPAARPPSLGLSLAIGFEPNSAQLRPESGEVLGALVAALLSAELRQHRFLIEGHTDASGTPAQNLRLSRERADQVRLYLVTLGVDSERLRAVGKGASDPVNPRDPHAAENRRVRVVALP